MKAAYIVGKQKLEIRDIPRPEIREDQMLVRVKACAICGTDLRIYRFGHDKIQYPAIIGHEISGIVEEVGKKIAGEVKPIKKGSRVMVAPGISCGKCENCLRGAFCLNRAAIGYKYSGGFAEYLVVPYEGTKNNIFPVPSDRDIVEYSIAEPLACAINGLERLGVIPLSGFGLVIGAGSIGVMLAKLLKKRGLMSITVSDISAEKLRLAERFLGADFIFINNKTEDLALAVEKVTGGRGCDIVIVACSSKQMQEESLKLAGLYGKVLYFAGLPFHDQAISFNSNLLHYRLLSVYGTYGSTLYQNLLAIQLISSGFTEGILTHHFSLDSIEEAFNFALQGKGLKLVIEP